MRKMNLNRIAMLALMLVAWVGALAQMVVCTGSNVRLRTGPSTAYPMLVWTSTNKPVYIEKGQSLTYLGNDSKDFYNVQFDGKSVYISKKFARLTTPNDNNKASSSKNAAAKHVVVNGENVRLRWGASLNATIYCDNKNKPIYPSKGAKLNYLGQTGDWYKVSYNGNTLYISKKHCLLQ